MLDTGQLQLTGEILRRFRQGLAAAVAQEYEQAIFHYDWVLETQADFYEAWYERGLALENCGDYKAAIASFDRAISLRPKPDAICQIWLERGNALQYGLGDYVGAIACYDQVLQLQPNHELAWINRGNALLYGLSAPAEALPCYDRTLQLNPANYLSWRNRGNALVELQRYEEAIASYDRALSIQPDDEVSWHARNLVSEKSGLSDRQPTTNPVWYGTGYSTQTLIQGNSGIQEGPEVEARSNGSTTAPSQFPSAQEAAHPLKGQPFVVVEDDWGRREILLERMQYLIGRDPKSDICLHSQFASRHHAVLTKVFRTDGSVAYQIVDGDLNGKASTNGLLINGRKLSVRELQPEDVIVFGPHIRLIYRFTSS